MNELKLANVLSTLLDSFCNSEKKVFVIGSLDAHSIYSDILDDMIVQPGR